MNSDDVKTVEIVKIDQPASIEGRSMAEIEAHVKRAIFMADKLDELRAAAVKRTVKSDWIEMGGKVYLEGDGGLRMAPVIGLELTNVVKEITTTEDGTTVVTMRGDGASKLFGVRLESLERTRTDKDGFLRGKADRADLADVVSACHKGLIARAAQLVAGLSGLTTEELKSRYGLEAGGKVDYKTGASDAKKADQATAKDDRAEIARILHKISEGNPQFAEDILVKLTENPSKGWPGKKDPAVLTEKGVAFVIGKLRQREADYDDAVEAEGKTE